MTLNRPVNAPGTEALIAEELEATVQPANDAVYTDVHRKKQTMKQRFSVAHATLTLLALTLLPATPGTAEQATQPLPPGGTYSGLTMAGWAVAMLQWGLSIPRSVNPDWSMDETGERAGIGQRAPVWFLPFVTERVPGTITRTYTVPEGHAILAVVGHSWFHAPPGKYSDAELRARGVDHEFLDAVAYGGTRRMDGVVIPNVRQYRVITPVFPVTLPTDNVLDVPVTPGKDARVAMVAAGHFLLFPPLPVGKHVFTHRSDSGHVNVTYNLIVQKANVPLQ
jgi:hypothetical protein